jgi:diguanylate cyclase (GGDEF)-like protein
MRNRPNSAERHLIRTARLWQRNIHSLFSLGRNATLFISAVLFSAIAVADYITPPQLNLTFLYVFVILLVCWNVGAVAGIVFAVLASAMQFVVFPGNTGIGLEPIYRYIILGNRVFTFLLVVGLTVPLRELHAREQRTSRTDFLTGALNRMAMYELLAVESARSRRTGNFFSVAYIDCDNFKAVNDQFGHEQGDELLRSAVKTIKHVLRATDAVARLGGDEFVVLLPGTTSEAALLIMDRLRAELDSVMVANDWPVTFSIGLGVFNRSESSPEEIVHRCDTLMYGVKAYRKNGIDWELVTAGNAPQGAESKLQRRFSAAGKLPN